MKNTICDGGCKKGDCNGDCKRSAVRTKKVKKAGLISNDPKLNMTGYDLQDDLLGAAIKKARNERHLSKKELGLLVGIKESQISRIENRLPIARFDSIIKVFKVLDIKINFSIELQDQTVTLE
jgi:HTH-type transcriptional regulator / antitoxin HipB